MLIEKIKLMIKHFSNIDILNQNNLLAGLDIIILLIFCVVFIKLSNKFIGKVFNKLIHKLKDTNSKKNIKTVRLLLLSTVNSIIIILVSLQILNRLGIDIKPILATAGVVGIAVGFGAQKLIEDLISGILLVVDGQIRAGDIVKIQNTLGTVEKLNLRLVAIRDFEGALHFFRNGTISDLINYTKDYSYALFETGVAYKEDISNVIDVIKNLFNDFKNNSAYKNFICDEIEIFGLDRFENSAIIIKYRIKTLPAKQWEVKRAFNLELKKKFDELNIEIPFPQVTVHQPTTKS